MESVIYLENDAHLYGLYSGKDTTIHSARTLATLYFYGAFSSYGATFICNSGGSSCIDLTLIENGGTIDVTCYYDALQSEACPNGTQLSSFMIDEIVIPNLTDIVEMDSSYNEYICDYNYSYNIINDTWTNAIYCGDYEECNINSNIQLINKNANGSICCTADSGCNNVSKIVLNSTQTGSIRCDGYQACKSSTITVTNIGNIHVSGMYACQSCTIVATLQSDMSSTTY